MTQLSLLAPSHEEAFALFHRHNPHVYEWLRENALALKRKGREHYGIAALFEAFRFHVAMNTRGDDFKLNNNHRAYYARLLMRDVHELRGFFDTRASAADGGIR
jgi:hypothetical protein